MWPERTDYRRGSDCGARDSAEDPANGCAADATDDGPDRSAAVMV
ncbi:hypothetical protein ACWDUL_03285 [Nocardia niigatensis]